MSTPHAAHNRPSAARTKRRLLVAPALGLLALAVPSVAGAADGRSFGSADAAERAMTRCAGERPLRFDMTFGSADAAERWILAGFERTLGAGSEYGSADAAARWLDGGCG